MTNIIFKGRCVNVNINLDETKMVCVPSKPKYGDVDICLVLNNCNLQIAGIVGASISFDEKIKLGNEIVKRWNATEEIIWLI